MRFTAYVRWVVTPRSWSIISWVSSSPSIRTILVSLRGWYSRASLVKEEVVMKMPFLAPCPASGVDDGGVAPYRSKPNRSSIPIKRWFIWISSAFSRSDSSERLSNRTSNSCRTTLSNAC